MSCHAEDGSIWMWLQDGCAYSGGETCRTWPVAHRGSSVGRWRSAVKAHPSKGCSPTGTPDWRRWEEVKKLEAAITRSNQGQPAPGPGNPQSFLETFGVDSVFPDESCKKLLDRVVRPQDVIDKAIAQKKLFEEEVAKGERRTRSTPGPSAKACGSVSTSVSSAGSDRCTDSRTRCRSHSVGA